MIDQIVGAALFVGAALVIAAAVVIPGTAAVTAAENVRAYLRGLEALQFTKPEDDDAIDGVFSDGETREITVRDLRTLCIQAEALEHVAPAAAKAIEIGPTT